MISTVSANGPLTLFRLHLAADKSVCLCRLDIKRFAEGDLSFTDVRALPPIDQSVKNKIVEESERYLQQMQAGQYLPDFDGFTLHFYKNRRRYEPLNLLDIGCYFKNCYGTPYVLLGSTVGERGCPIAIHDLANDELVRGCVARVSQDLSIWRLGPNECTVETAKPLFKNLTKTPISD